MSPAAEEGEEEVVGYDWELFDDHDEEEAEGRIRTGVEKSDEGVGAGAGGRVGDGNGTTHVTWNNDAAIRITSGFDENNWISANYVAKITGLLYNDITGVCYVDICAKFRFFYLLSMDWLIDFVSHARPGLHV